MKSLKPISITILLSLLTYFPLYSVSHYFYDDFSSGVFSSAWSNSVAYGRSDGTITPTAEGNDFSTHNINNEEIELRETCNDGNGARNGYWMGRYVYNTNKFDARSTSPFGVETIRTFAWLDYERNNVNPGYTGDIRRHCAVSIWLFEDKPIPKLRTAVGSETDFWEVFNNSIEFVNEVGVWGNNDRRHQIAYFETSLVDLNLSSAVRPDGRTIDVTDRVNFDFRLDLNTGVSQSDEVGFRMIHNGKFIKFYANPDPYNNDAGYPCEWVYIGKRQVVWKDNIQFMIGHSQLANNNNSGDTGSVAPEQHDFREQANFDNVSVKSTSDKTAVGFESYYIERQTNYQWITMVMTNSITSQNAGINYIRIIKPAEFKWNSNITNAIVVRNHYDNNTAERTLTTILYRTNTYPGNGQAAVLTNFGTDEIRLILRNQITNLGESQNIKIDMHMMISNSFNTLIFTNYTAAECFENMPDTDKTNYSTCGWQKATGNGDVKKSLDEANGFSSITPDEIIQGSDSYSFTFYLKSGDEYSKDINQAAIVIPSVFVIDTNSIDSFLLEDDAANISVTTNSQLVSVNSNIIFINYGKTSEPLTAGGEMDIITFSIKDQTETGLHKWKCYVDNGTLNSSSYLAITNSTFNNQELTVIGAPPDTAAGIITPTPVNNKVILFNTLTSYTLEYKIENRADVGETDNKIQVAVITNPAIFTNIEIIQADWITSGNIKIGQGTGGNTSTITLFYCYETVTPSTGPIPPQEADIIKIFVQHNIPELQTTNVRYSCIVNNSNGKGFYSLNVNLDQDVMVTDPYPIGTVDCQPADGTIYTSDSTNVIEYKLYNGAPSGKILFVDIFLSTNYFVLATNITSLHATNGITYSNNTIHIDYTVDNYPIDVNQLDTISFTLVDDYSNHPVADNVLVTSRVANITKTNDTTDKDNLTGLNRTLYFVPQEARVKSYITNANYILTEVTTSTLNYVIENYGDTGNKISYAEYKFTELGGEDITNIISVNGTLSGVWNISNLFFKKNNYNLDGGQRDVLTIKIQDSILSETTRDIIPKVTVNTSSLVTPLKPNGKTNKILFQIPPPVGLGKINPKEMFTSVTTITNHFTYTVYNDGDGSNELERIIITLPELLYNKVTALSNSWMANEVYITNNPTNIIIDYKGYNDPLDVKTNDLIYLQIINNITSKSDVVFNLQAANNDGKGYYSTGIIAGETKTLSIIGQPEAYITSPPYIESASSTNTITYRIKNSDDGYALLRSRILIPAGITVLSNTISGSWPSAAYTISNSYLKINYSANDLDAGGYDEIIFDAVDTYSKTSTSLLWDSEIQYENGGFYYITKTNTGTKYLNIQFTPVNADSYLYPNQALVSTETNSFTFTITNRGYGSNSIYEAYIYYPTALLNVIDENSSKLNPANVYVNDGAGYIQLRYYLEGNLLAGEKDDITFKFVDLVGSQTTYTLSCQVSNGLAPVETSEDAGSKVIDFIAARIDSYITPNQIQTTTGTNTFTYRINNAGDSNPYYKVVLNVPPIFTNIISINSTVLGNIAPTGNISKITLNYTNASSLSAGENDVLTIAAVDSLSSGFSNVSWTADASNISWTHGINTTGGQSQNINFVMPHPDAKVYITPDEIYTTSVSNNLTYKVYNAGNGSNNLLDMIVFIPSTFTNILNVTSSHLTEQSNIRPDTFGNITSFTIHYCNDPSGPLTTSLTDTLSIITYDNVTNLNTTSIWTSHVRNVTSGTLFSTSLLTGKSKTTEFVKPPLVNITPNQIETTTLSNEFTYTINNAGAGGSSSLRTAKIYYDSLIYTNVSISGSSASNISYAGNYIQLIYGPALDFGVTDTFTIKTFDNKLSGSTNTTWSAAMSKGNGFNQAIVQGSINVNIQMPTASGIASVSPNQLSTEIVSNAYTCKIVNSGSDYNYIKLAKITLPVSLTNVPIVSSEITPDTAVQGNIVWIYYTNGGTFVTGATDQITIGAQDDILTNISTTWDIQAANSIDTNNLAATTIIPGSSKVINYQKPDPQANSIITPLSISAFETNFLFTLYITNKGTLYNYIYQAKITPPDFITNITGLTSSFIGNGVNITFSNNSYIIVNYEDAGYNFDGNTVDTIKFYTWDNITTATSGQWNIDINNGNGSGFVNSDTINLSVSVPPPDAGGDIKPNIYFTDAVANTFICRLANFGLGNNSIKNAVIEFPAGITITGASSSEMANNNIITNTTSITLHYSTDGNGSLITSKTDTITITCTDTFTSEYDDFAVIIKVDNGTGSYSNISALTGNSKNVNLVLRPSGDITPDPIESETITNTFTYHIFNEGFQGAEIKQARIWIPSIYTNNKTMITNTMTSVQLSSTINASINSQWLTLDYDTDPGDLRKQELETLTFKAIDSISKTSNTTIWTLQINYNDEYGWHSTENYASGDQDLNIHLTKAKANAYLTYNDYYYTSTTNQFKVIVTNSGTGSNYWETLRLRIPSSNYIFTSLGVTSSYLANDAGNISRSLVGNDIVIEADYTAETVLPAQTVETMTITLADNINHTFSDRLEVHVDNGDGRGYTGAEIGSNISINYKLPGNAYISENNISTTISTNVYFTYTFVNSSTYKVNKLFIPIPGFITNIQVDSSHIANDGAQIKSSVSGITLHYAADPNGQIDFSDNDLITLTTMDNFTYGMTNFTFESYMHVSNIGYVPTKTTVSKSKDVLYRMPDADAIAYILPDSISTVSTSNEFTYVIQNRGSGSDNILHAKISIPAGFTKATNISSSIIGNDALYARQVGATIELDYQSDTSYISPQSFETVVFTAYDTITTEGSYNWQSEVDNRINPTNYASTGLYGGKTKMVQIQVPGYVSESYINPTNTYSTKTNKHTFNVVIKNVGSSGNVINTADIYIPTTAFKTNGIGFSSARVSNSYITLLTNNIIRIDYISQSTQIGVLENDTVTIDVYDTLTTGTQTVIWDVKTKFNTSPNFIDTSVPTGQSEKVHLLMPDASAEAYITPESIYTVASNSTFKYRITNTGTGDNAITKLKIYVPNQFQFNLIPADISSSHLSTTTPSYSGGVITVSYHLDGSGSLVTCDTDTITIQVEDNVSSATNNINWLSEADNLTTSTNYVSTIPPTGKVQDVDILDSTAQANADIDPNSIYSTDVTNILSYHVQNLGLAVDKVYYLKIKIPDEVTNVHNVSSSIIGTTGVSVDWSTSNIIVNYSSQGTFIGSGISDTITFTAIDNIDFNTNTLLWDSWVNFSNTLGFIQTGTGGGQSKKIALTIPPLDHEGELITRTIQKSETLTNRTIIYKIRNNGTGNNNIYRAVIKIPNVFAPYFPGDFRILSDVIADDTANIETAIVAGTNRLIRLKYSDDTLLAAGLEDTITIMVTNFNIADEHYGKTFRCYATNQPSAIDPADENDKGIKLDIVDPSPYRADAYLTPDSQSIYTLDKTAEIDYRIDNKSSKYNITNVVITFKQALFTNVRVSSRLTSTNNITITSTNITIDYLANEFTKIGAGADYEIVKIYFEYDINTVSSWTMNCKVGFNDGSTIIDAQEGSETQILSLQYAYWGKITGLVQPNENATFNLYHAGSDNNATNYLGQSAFISVVQPGSNVAKFTIDRLPPGIYDLTVQKPGFKTTRCKVNLSIVSNFLTDAGLVILKNEKIEASANDDRYIYCFDDNKQSYLFAPVSSILNDFYLDIYKKTISSDQISGITKTKNILTPTLPGSIKIFDFALEDLKSKSLDEIELAKTVTIVLHYEYSEIQNQGWTEESLSIFYWKHTTKEWIRMGGILDKNKKTLTIKTAYLHTAYAIFGAVAVDYTKIFGDLKAWPRAFTPGRGGTAFEKFKVSCIFKEPVKEYSFRIYDLNGRMLYEKTFNSGPYNQAEIPWDGRNSDGVYVKSGFYTYQIEVGEVYYRGSLMVIK